MTAKVVALYNTPADTAAFDQYYFAKHVPLAKTLPGLRSYEVSTGPVAGLDGGATHHLAAILTFDSAAAISAAVASPAGAATAGDLANFATGGVTLLVFETREI